VLGDLCGGKWWGILGNGFQRFAVSNLRSLDKLRTGFAIAHGALLDKEDGGRLPTLRRARNGRALYTSRWRCVVGDQNAQRCCAFGGICGGNGRKEIWLGRFSAGWRFALGDKRILGQLAIFNLFF
jgi:hypothetical protein